MYININNFLICNKVNDLKVLYKYICLLTANI